MNLNIKPLVFEFFLGYIYSLEANLNLLEVDDIILLIEFLIGYDIRFLLIKSLKYLLLTTKSVNQTKFFFLLKSYLDFRWIYD